MLWQLLVWVCRDPLKNSLAGQHTVILGEGWRGGEVSKGTVDGISQVTSIKIYMYVSLMYSINLF